MGTSRTDEGLGRAMLSSTNNHCLSRNSFRFAFGPWGKKKPMLDHLISELLVINRVLSDPPSPKQGYGQQYSIIKWKQGIGDQT